MRHLRGVLFLTIIGIPSFTLGQTVFDVSGTIQGSGVLVPASWSGTLALAGSYPTFSISDWNISLPPIQASQSTLPASVFTPANSTATLVTEQQDTGLVWFFTFNNTQGQSLSIGVNAGSFNPNATNLGVTYFHFSQSGVPYAATQGSATLTPTPVPEPSSGILLLTGLAGLALFGRKLIARHFVFYS